VQKIIVRKSACSTGSKQRGALLERRLTERFGNHRHVGDIRGRGLFQAVELVDDRATRKPFDPALNSCAQSRPSLCARAGCYPMGGTVDGRIGDHVVLAPPFIVSDGEVEMIVDRLGQAVDGVLKSVDR
jgi:adenosylmethionine-8-amino-7-oxononanoate aminotransferase